jgi:HPt (histidine-containing phosphotransfer) domain-containing protein
VASQRDVVGDIRRAIDNKDFETAERLAHTAKSVSGNVGAVTAQERAAQLEAALRERRATTELEPLTRALDGTMSPLLASLGEAIT